MKKTVDHYNIIMHCPEDKAGQQELAELKASLDVIHSTAGEIINAIQPLPPELERKAPEQQPQHRKSKKSMRK